MSLGEWHSAAIAENGDLYLWGYDSSGLGNGIDKSSNIPIKIMSNVKKVNLCRGDANGGDAHNAIITEDGDLYLWGHNWNGKIGNLESKGYTTIPVKIMSNIKEVSLGGSHSAAITENGDLYLWGSNDWQQIGDGYNSVESRPQKIMSDVKEVSLGGSHSAAITENGDLYLWGWNYNGELGMGITESSTGVPFKVMNSTRKVSLGDSWSATITETGDLYLWGGNWFGQLGNGTTANSSVPIKIEIPSESEDEEVTPDTQTTIRYGRGANSFDKEIIDYCGNTIETTVMLKSEEYTIDDLTILSSNNAVVEIESIEKDRGDYIPVDDTEHTALIRLKMKEVGNSDIMITAPDGTFKSFSVISKEAIYSIKLYSYIPVLTVGKGTSIGMMVQLDRNGTIVTEDLSFSIVSSNSNVLSVSDICNEEDGTIFYINGVSEGNAILTVTDTVSKAVYSTEIEVDSGILTYNADAMPKYYNREKEYNAYVDGLFIDEFKTKKIEDSKLLVTFNVYNTTSKNGAVDVYNAEGELIRSEMINRFTDNYVTTIKDTFISVYRLLEDKFIDGDILTFKQDSFSEKTPIEVKVPRGGRIEITNNPQYSNTCAIYNAVDFITTTILMLGDNLKAEEAKKVSRSTAKNVVVRFFENYAGALDGKNAAEKIGELGQAFAEKIGEEGMKGMLESTLKGNIASFIDDGKVILENCKVDLDELILSSAADIGIGLAEDTLMKAMALPGAVLSSMFKVNEYLGYASFLVDMCAIDNNKALKIYIDDENGCLYDGGVSVKAENGTNDLSQDNYVIHSVVLSKEMDLSNQIKESLDKVSKNYVVRDIYLQKDGVITQPNQNVQVTISVPEEYDIYRCKLYWVQEDGTLTEVKTKISGNNLIFVTNHFSYYAIVESKNIGAINGRIISFGDENINTTVQLLDGNGAVVDETSVTGTNAEYLLENVSAGTYTLQVSKQNHVTRQYVLTMGMEILTQNAELRLIGDSNGDGRINARDKKIVYNCISGLSVLDDYDFAVTDSNGDDKVNARDKKMIYNHIAGVSLLW